MISKNDLKGRYVEFVSKTGATRTCRVYRVSGKTLSVATIVTINKKRYRLHRERIHPDKNKIFGVYIRKKIVPIEWNGRKKLS